MIHKAKDLSPDQRLAVESLLGHTLSEFDDVSVRPLSPPPQLSPEGRHEVVAGLKNYFSKIDAQRRPVSAKEADEIINEALRSTRPNYRPIR